jgi:hypothetical protein
MGQTSLDKLNFYSKQQSFWTQTYPAMRKRQESARAAGIFLVCK